MNRGQMAVFITRALNTHQCPSDRFVTVQASETDVFVGESMIRPLLQASVRD